jgi:hypothetical protein
MSLADGLDHPIDTEKVERPVKQHASSIVITNAWPQILLGNEIRLNNGGTIMGTSGFLVKLPDETILGVVPLDTLEPAGLDASSLQRLNSFSDAVDSWKMYPRYDPGQSIAFEGVYDRYKKIHPETADYRDYLLISFIGDRIDIPSIPLEIAKTKPEIDQPVFVLSVSNSEEFLHQTVYSAMVSAYDKSKAMLVVTIELPLGSERMKSMPVLTTRGELLGIISNHRPRPIGRVRENTVQLLAHFAGAILNSETDGFDSPALISSAGSEE